MNATYPPPNQPPYQPPPLPPEPPTSGAQQPGSQPPLLSGFFDRVRSWGLVRPIPRSGPGVCRAIGDRWGLDPLIVRLAFVVFALMGALGVLVYGLAWLLLPEADGRIHAEEFLRRGRLSGGFVGSAVLIVVGFGGLGSFNLGADHGPRWPFFWFLVAAAIVSFVVYRSRHAGPGAGPAWTGSRSTGTPATGGHSADNPVDLTKTHAAGADQHTGAAPQAGWQYNAPPPYVPPQNSAQQQNNSAQQQNSVPPRNSVPPPVAPRRPRRRPAGPRIVAAVAGLALIAMAGVGGLGFFFGWRPSGGLLLWAAMSVVAVIGLATMIVGLLGRRAGGLIGLAVLCVPLVMVGLVASQVGQGRLDRFRPYIAATDSGYRHTSGMDDRQWTLSGPVVHDESYIATAGDGRLDLTGISALPVGQPVHTISVEAAAGDMTVLVPKGQTIAIDLNERAGDVQVDGQNPQAVAGASVSTSDHVVTVLGPSGDPAVRLVGTALAGDISIESR